MIDTSELFKPPTSWEYPRYNTMTFEEYFYQYYVRNLPTTKRKYLPVLWSNFYYKRHFRSDGTKDLQDYLDQLDPAESYFTVVVYDGGIHEVVNHLDLKVFSSVGDTISINPLTHKGNLGDRAIPLVCMPSPTINRNRQRDVLAGFIGGRTHPLREILWDTLSEEEGFVLGKSIINPNMGFQIMDDKKWAAVNYEQFQDLMEHNVFALCPRGSSTTSFRICESLQYGAVPVYISDKFWFPWSNPKDPSDHGIFDQIGLTCLPEEIPDLSKRLREIPQSRIDDYLQAGKEIYKTHFTLEACAKRIIDEVNQE